MNIIAPDYYTDFSCIAEKCRHSCCIGWEIDIDKKSEEYYKSINSEFGDKLRDSISYEDNTPHFKLTQNERCPFLTDTNLCEIYINLGEKSLCQICSDHPRFRNFFECRIEIGLGLCCEEAARMIITKEDTLKLVCIKQVKKENCPDDEVFFNFRQKIFSIIQDRNTTIKERILNLHKELNIPITKLLIHDIFKLYNSLEILDFSWNDRLKALKNSQYIPFSDSSIAICEEQLLVYFIYRHLADAQYDGMYHERIMFSILSVAVIDIIYHENPIKSIAELIEISRMYSSEIEYSDENITKILDFFVNAEITARE